MQHADPGAEQRRVDVQVDALGAARVGGVARIEVGEVRIDQELKGERDPEKRAEAALGAVDREHQKAVGERARADRVVDPRHGMSAVPRVHAAA